MGYLMEEMNRESMQSNIETGKAVEGFLLISAVYSQSLLQDSTKGLRFIRNKFKKCVQAATEPVVAAVNTKK